jgi:transcriptional regulator, XRE family
MDIFEIRLRELRKQEKLTQKELAIKLKTTDDSIYSWEKGRSQPEIEQIRNICKIFNVSANYLLGLKNEFDELN